MNAKKTTPTLVTSSLLKALPSAHEAYVDLLAFQSVVDGIHKELDKSAKGGAIQLARAFVVLRKLKDAFDETDKKFTAVFERCKNEMVPQAFENDGVTSVPLAEGFRVGVSSATRASIKPDKKQQAYAWLEENDMGSLITPTVNASTLSAAAKSMLEEHNKEFPPEFFNVALMSTTSVTTVKK